MTQTFERSPLFLSHGEGKVPLHSCCVTCSVGVMEAMQG